LKAVDENKMASGKIFFLFYLVFCLRFFFSIFFIRKGVGKLGVFFIEKAPIIN